MTAFPDPDGIMLAGYGYIIRVQCSQRMAQLFWHGQRNERKAVSRWLLKQANKMIRANGAKQD